jgi:hypothetical protein
MHGVNKAKAFSYPAFPDYFIHLRGNIKEFLAVFGIEDKIFGIRFHYIYL